MMAKTRLFFVILAVAVSSGCLSKPRDEVTVVGPPAEDQVTVADSSEEAAGRYGVTFLTNEETSQITYANEGCREGKKVSCASAAEPGVTYGQMNFWRLPWAEFAKLNNLKATDTPDTVVPMFRFVAFKYVGKPS